jgi:hypothetical protein
VLETDQLTGSLQLASTALRVVGLQSAVCQLVANMVAAGQKRW